MEKWRGRISLPALPTRKLSVGANVIQQQPFGGIFCEASVHATDVQGYDEIRTTLPAPYERLLLRRPKARRQAHALASVTSVSGTDAAEWPADMAVRWDRLGDLETYCDTPEKVVAAWKNQFRFREENAETGDAGLRRPQIGALHAVAAHFAVGKVFEPATVVLPTGTGKTETMLAALVYQRLPRVLVLVPSTALRTQIFKKFIELGVLPHAAVVPPFIAKPRVAFIRAGLREIEQAREVLANANVIVALPNVLESSRPDAAEALISGCTDLFVDEAHHITAKTWSAVREKFLEKRVLQFTATPFRRDGKKIDGKIIFNYKLGDAQTDDYYRPISLRTVEEYGDDGARDRAVASAAIQVLKRDRDELNLDHLLMARTRTKDRANAVVAIYREIAPELSPVVVYSGPGRGGENKAALLRMLDRGAAGSRVIVCVDMLGEGFDLPNLKVAALHDTHKSLAITLQFIGRFTRRGAPERIGNATVVANIADPDMENKLARLYSEGADWDHLIRRLSEDRIGAELRLQDVITGLKESGSLASQLSLWNLRPALSTQFFRTSCETWDPERYRTVLGSDTVAWHAYNEREKVLVAVVHRGLEVSWGNYQNVEDKVYDLLILKWDQDNRVLALYASDYDTLKSDEVAVAVTDERTQLVTGNPIFRILNNVELPLVKSLGSSRVGAISFTSYFGPNVTDGLANIEKLQAELNNIACLGYENGERVLWGGTKRRGKVWQVKSGSVSDWMEWTAATWAKVSVEDEEVANITRDFLRPTKLARPYSGYPIAVQWGERVQTMASESQAIVFGETAVPLLMIDVEVSGVRESGEIIMRLSSDDQASEYLLRISEELNFGYEHEHVSGPELSFKRGRSNAIPFVEYLQKDPLIVRYADGTYSYNCYHIAAPLEAGLYPRERLEEWDWDGIPLNKESMHKVRDRDTIQYRSFLRLQDEYDIVFNDDGSGEAADLICLKNDADGSIVLCLVHCKGAHGGRVSQDIRNFYVVCGQAQKNITVKHKGLPRLYADLKRRQEAWLQTGADRFLKGDMKSLSFFKEKARKSPLKFEVILVQPGASIATITDDALKLLATTELFLTKTTEASLRVVLSA